MRFSLRHHACSLLTLALAFELAACSARVVGDGGPDAASDGDTPAVDAGPLGNCFGIFPQVMPANPGADAGERNSNPLELAFGAVPVGASATASIRYDNFCNDRDASYLGAELRGEGGGAADPSFEIVEAGPDLAASAEVWRLVVRFTPRAAGEHRARAYFRMNHGYYETRFSGRGQ
jgi:hypothetical protein